MGKHLCCKGPGGKPCNRVRLEQPYDITQDCRACWLFHHVAAYNLAWGGDGKVTKAPNAPVHRATPAPPDHGPGTELRKLLESLGIRKEVGCKCGAKEAEMNRLGIDGCKSHRDEIAQWLRDNARERGWWEKAKAAAIAAAKGIAFQLDMSNLYGSLVDLAIQRAAVIEHTSENRPEAGQT